MQAICVPSKGGEGLLSIIWLAMKDTIITVAVSTAA
jgi:hypothetical protein